MKKIIVIQMKKRVYKVLGKLAAAALLLGMSGSCVMEASATENIPSEETTAPETLEETKTPLNQTVTYIYHQHIGSSDVEGGCYYGPVYHTHSGSEAEGGECYQTPVYHIHTGDEINGGECYGTPILHQHTGNPETGGGCFVPVYHSHTSSCYQTISSSEYGCTIVKWWDTSDGDYEGHDYKYYVMSCGVTVHGTNSSHNHTITVCNKEGTIERYTLGCGKTEESADSYVFDCEKRQGLTIDSYLFSCEKTEATIDGYSLNCGRDEETPYGKIIITEQQGDSKTETLMLASFEDLSDGELQLADDPYVWKDVNGNVIGTGDSITVSQNGNYSVTLEVINEDVNRDSLKADINISSIVKPQKDSGNDNAGNSDGNEGENQGGDPDGDNGEEESTAQSESTPTPAPTATPVQENVTKNSGDDNADKGGNGQSEDFQDRNAQNKVMDESDDTSKIPSATPMQESKTESVSLQENSSKDMEIEEIKVVEPASKESGLKQFFASPVVRMISITAGTLSALAGILLLVYFLRMSVRLYNDDGEGRMIYLGRCRVHLKEEGYTIEISDAMAEKAVTNRYCIKPGLFRVMKSEEEEIIVCRLQKRVSVYLSKEMIVII